MWRKRKPLLPGSSLFKSAPSSTATPGSGSGQSRRTRFVRSLGLSTLGTQTGTDSQSRTILGSEEDAGEHGEHGEHGAFGVELSKEGSAVTATSRPVQHSQHFKSVERGRSHPSEGGGEASRSNEEVQMAEGSSEGPPPMRQVWAKGPATVPPKQGVKKNVWEVRRK